MQSTFYTRVDIRRSVNASPLEVCHAEAA